MWETKKLGELVKFYSGGTPNKNIADYWNGDIPWISAKTMKGDRISTSELFITRDGLEHGSKLAPVGSLLLLVRGSGLFNGIPVCYVEKPVAYNQDIKCIQTCSEVENEYIYYWLKAKSDFLQKSLDVTGIGAGKFDTKFLSELDVSFPNKETRRKIIDFVNNLTEKLIVNTQINRNLSEQAFAMFESVYQEYPERRIGDLDICITDYVANGSFASLKENVTILEEKDYAYFVRNVDLKAKEFPRFVNQHSYEFLSKSKLFGGEVIISNVGDVGSVFLCPKLDGPMTLGNNMIMITSQKHNNYLYLFFNSYIGQAKINGITGGSAQPKFNKTDFKSLMINYPDDVQVDDFNEKTSTLLDLISKLEEENKRLAALRDSLLPKLMSGEVDVSNLEI